MAPRKALAEVIIGSISKAMSSETANTFKGWAPHQHDVVAFSEKATWVDKRDIKFVRSSGTSHLQYVNLMDRDTRSGQMPHNP